MPLSHYKPLESSRRRRRKHAPHRDVVILDAVSPKLRRLYVLEAARPGIHGVQECQKGAGLEGTQPPTPDTSNRHTGELVSIYGILARYLEFELRCAEEEEYKEGGRTGFELSTQEDSVLDSKGYSLENVKQWAACILALSSLDAAGIFLPHHPDPPMFIVLLFLRRVHIRKRGLALLIQHLHDRLLQRTRISWSELQVLTIRLLHHARIIWPELIPTIAELFTREAERIIETSVFEGRKSRLLSDMSRFCNRILAIMSLPSKVRAVVSASHQQTGQFRILQFMAAQESHDGSRSALVVNRHGFRSAIRNQLAHSKTDKERDWAHLKGTHWPPWVREHTAMDEDKGYEYGASRASQVIHRMREAGYASNRWEQVAQVYAGWDTDLSPTIQTRTLLPDVPTHLNNSKRLDRLLWAARVRATRTKREAWACFLACEASGTPATQEVYYAMLEKLTLPELDMEQYSDPSNGPMAGDRKAVLPEPTSAHELVHISEPVPSIDQLFSRMTKNGIQTSVRIGALILEVAPSMSWALSILSGLETSYGGDVARLLDGSILKQSSTRLPDYFLSSFIYCLCRHGRVSELPTVEPIQPSEYEHEHGFPHDKGYLLQYAYALLYRFFPRHRLGLTEYMQVLLLSPWNVQQTMYGSKHAYQYEVLCALLERMREVDLDIEEEQFRKVCVALRSVAHSVQNGLARDVAEDVFTNGLRRLRRMFQELVGAYPGAEVTHQKQPRISVPHRVPGLATLHAYARALGALHDYEGLYSFTTWLSSNHSELTQRAGVQIGGQRHLRGMLRAIRRGMEGSESLRGLQSAPEELVSLVKSQVEEFAEWGGWPSDEEMAGYEEGKRKMIRRAGNSQ